MLNISQISSLITITIIIKSINIIYYSLSISSKNNTYSIRIRIIKILRISNIILF